MTNKQKATMTLTAAAITVGQAVAQTETPAVDKTLEILKTYDWGDDRETLNPIDQAVIDTHDDPAARKALEKALVDVLTGGISRSAQDYVCRRLRVIGTTQSIKALAALLPDEKTSHIARYALERLLSEAAVGAMRDALPKVSDKLKPGLMGSLGVRRDKKSVEAISKLLDSTDVEIACAATHSLGLIATPAAADVLTKHMKSAPANLKLPAADACLLCAEQLLADGHKAKAIALYKELRSSDLPAHVKTAATKGMLTATARK